MSLLGIDLGTTGCKAGVFGLDGECLASAYREYDMRHARHGWAELDSVAVWKKTREVIGEAVARAAQATQGATADPVSALAVSAFGEAFVPVTKARTILDDSILCVDERGREHVDRLIEHFGRERFYRINPNLLGPNYSLPKLLWLREHRPQVYRDADHFLLWSDFVAFMLGGDAVANNSHANRTLLFDLAADDWSDELLAWSGIERGTLGRVVHGGTPIGRVSPALADELGLPRGVAIVAGGHDQCCNALGCGGIAPGLAVYGMGSFDCITPIYAKPDDTLRLFAENLNVEHHVLPGLYVSFLYNQGGLLVKWFRDTFAAAERGPADASDGRAYDLYAQLDGEMPADPTRLLVLPHFDPPPHHGEPTSGVIVGLTMETTRGEILKAIREATTLHFVSGLAALAKLGIDTCEFIAAGGGARSDRGLQLRADVLGIPIVRPRTTEAGMLGAAMLAGLATGVFGSAQQAVDLFVRRDRVFDPDARRHALYREKHTLFAQLYPSLRSILARL